MHNPIAVAPSPLSGGNRIGNRQAYMWLIKDAGEPGGMRFMQKFGAPPNHPEDGARVAAMCNDSALERFGLGQVAEIDQKTGQHRWGRVEGNLGRKCKHRFYEGQVESVPSKDGELWSALEDVHVLRPETQELFRDPARGCWIEVLRRKEGRADEPSRPVERQPGAFLGI